jgi:phage terminase large subunit-like protein
VDPPASTERTRGIVVCGSDEAGVLNVLADASVGGATPERWARAAAAAAESWGADRVIAEKNQGGDMVLSVLKTVAPDLLVTLVSASKGKSARAEPVAALFESGRARLAGAFPKLEDELAGLLIGGGYAGPGRSPDRADACVWAMTALMKRRRAEPRARGCSSEERRAADPVERRPRYRAGELPGPDGRKACLVRHAPQVAQNG